MSGASIMLDTRGFEKMVRELSRISGKDFGTALTQQAGAVLKSCISKTKQRDRKYMARFLKTNHGIHLPDGSRVAECENGREWFLDVSNLSDQKKWFGKKTKAPKKVVKGRTFHLMNGNKRWGNARWAKWQMAKQQLAMHKARNDKAALAAIGLSKKSWLEVALDLGLTAAQMKASRVVQKARSSNGFARAGGYGRREFTSSAMFIEILNRMPTLQNERNKGAKILQWAINSRKGAFERELRLGVFTDIERRKQRYPGLFS